MAGGVGSGGAHRHADDVGGLHGQAAPNNPVHLALAVGCAGGARSHALRPGASHGHSLATTDPWHRPHLLRPRPTPGQRYSACLQGSHRPIASHWEAALSDEHRAQLPRVHGLRLQPTPALPSYPEVIPEADRWLGTEPTAVVARRGQATLITTSVVHSAWKNRDVVPRKAIQCQITAAGVSVGHPRSECEAVSKLYPELRRRFRPERRHLAMPSPIIHRESGHEDKWLEGGHVCAAAAKL